MNPDDIPLLMPNVAKAKSDLATYVKANYSVSWSVCKVVSDYRLWNFEGKGNAWINDIMALYHGYFQRGDRHTYI